MNLNSVAGKLRAVGSAELDPTEAHGLGGLYHSSPDRAKQSFLAAMSHELRTPLNAIIGFSEIMDAEVFGPLSAPQYSEYVRDILGSARRLLHIIEDVLEISRAEAGELVLSKREVDVGELIDEFLRPFRDWCRSRRIKVVTDVPDHIVIHVDPHKIRRVLASLISNAVKFSGDRTSIALAARLDESGLLTLSVRDRGIGMDPEAIERAFVPFAQLDDFPRGSSTGPAWVCRSPACWSSFTMAGSRSTARRASARRRRSFCLHTRPRPGSSAHPPRHSSSSNARTCSICSGLGIEPAISRPSASARRSAV